MLGQLAMSSFLSECEGGYVFTPNGKLGKAYFVPAASSGGIVTGAKFFGLSVFLVIAAIVGAFFYYKITKTYTALGPALGFAALWMITFYIWAALSKRGLEEVSWEGQGGSDAG